MKPIQITKFQCEICGTQYGTAELAIKCEQMPVREDKGVKIGDTVLITSGEGAGHKAVVASRSIVDMEWGYYNWKIYWHTVMLSAKLIDSWGSRQLTFDSYEVTKP